MNSPNTPPKPATPPKPGLPPKPGMPPKPDSAPVASASSLEAVPPKPATEPPAGSADNSQAEVVVPEKPAGAPPAVAGDNPWANPQPAKGKKTGAVKSEKPKGSKLSRRRDRRKKKRERKPVNVPKLGMYLLVVTLVGASAVAVGLS